MPSLETAQLMMLKAKGSSLRTLSLCVQGTSHLCVQGTSHLCVQGTSHLCVQGTSHLCVQGTTPPSPSPRVLQA